MYAVRPDSGLGAYPTDAYYDKNRPWWLPYWIDDPLESQAKYPFMAGQNVTTQEVIDPGSVYKTPPVILPPPGTPTGSELTIAPASGAEAQATIDRILADQVRAGQAQNVEFMKGIAENIKAQVQSLCPGKVLVQDADGNWTCPSLFSGIPTWMLWAGGALVGVVGLSMLGGGSPRRYGR